MTGSIKIVLLIFISSLFVSCFSQNAKYQLSSDKKGWIFIILTKDSSKLVMDNGFFVIDSNNVGFIHESVVVSSKGFSIYDANGSEIPESQFKYIGIEETATSKFYSFYYPVNGEVIKSYDPIDHSKKDSIKQKYIDDLKNMDYPF